MSNDPIEDAHRAMAAAHRKFEDDVRLARLELRVAMDDIFRQMQAEMRRGPGGQGPGPDDMGARGRRPRGPVPRGPGGPMPMPVKPDRPNLLSGGAEVPLDD